MNIKNYVIKMISVIALSAITQITFSQNVKKPHYLDIGDHMPDLEINNIINSNLKTARISDFKGKLVILDFWNSFCGGCIAGFPKLNSLQLQYKDKIQVLLINPASDHETMRSMKIVINRMNLWGKQQFKLPIVYSDTTISKNFLFYGVPFQVWISPDGNIVAMPDKTALTTENIDGILAGRQMNIKRKVQTQGAIRKVEL